MNDYKFNCPHCDQSLEAPPEMLGEAIECPACQGAIQLPDPDPAPTIESTPLRQSIEENKLDVDTKECPFCGEQILAKAKKCKHCGEFLDQDAQSTHGEQHSLQAQTPDEFQLLDNKGLEPIIGKQGNPFKTLMAKSNYISGIKVFDNLIESKSLQDAPLLTLDIYEKGIAFVLSQGLKAHRAGLPNDRIKNIALEDKAQIYEQKNKSVVGRAVIGGLLAGPFGAVIGGMSGTGAKMKAADMPDLFISLSYVDVQGQDRIIVLSCPYKHKAAAQAFFKKYYPRKFQVQI